MSPQTASTLRIGQFAVACGVTPRTIRFYEQQGLLSAIPRQTHTMRRYSPDLIARVERIQHLQTLLDWSLEDIRAALVLEDQVATLRTQYYQNPSVIHRQNLLDEAIQLTTNQLTRVYQRMESLQNLQRDLEDKLSRYRALRAESDREDDAR